MGNRDITFSLPHTATAADVVTGALQRAEIPFEASLQSKKETLVRV
jgi:hypothetical protein